MAGFMRYVPQTFLILSLAVYLASLIAPAIELPHARDAYNTLCRGSSRACWPFFYEVWIVATSFGAFSLVASAALLFLHSSKGSRNIVKSPRTATTVSLAVCALLAAMWLAVVVLGWYPLNINLRAGYNGIPEFISGTSSSTRISTVDKRPYAGEFRYAMAWYWSTNWASTRYSLSTFRTEPANAALAAVVTSNLAFAWSVVVLVVLSLHACVFKPVVHPDGPITKEREGEHGASV